MLVCAIFKIVMCLLLNIFVISHDNIFGKKSIKRVSIMFQSGTDFYSPRRLEISGVHGQRKDGSPCSRLWWKGPKVMITRQVTDRRKVVDKHFLPHLPRAPTTVHERISNPRARETSACRQLALWQCRPESTPLSWTPLFFSADLRTPLRFTRFSRTLCTRWTTSSVEWWRPWRRMAFMTTHCRGSRATTGRGRKNASTGNVATDTGENVELKICLSCSLQSMRDPAQGGWPFEPLLSDIGGLQGVNSKRRRMSADHHWHFIRVLVSRWKIWLTFWKCTRGGDRTV